MNTQKILNYVFPLLAFSVIVFCIILMFVFSAQRTQDQFLWYCYQHNFPANFTMEGELSGSFDCQEYYINTYDNGKWGKRCSSLWYSEGPTCHELCIIDCAFQNKKNKEIMCVC